MNPDPNPNPKPNRNNPSYLLDTIILLGYNVRFGCTFRVQKLTLYPARLIKLKSSQIGKNGTEPQKM